MSNIHKTERSDKVVDLFFTPAAVSNERLKGFTTVVIDVLRAATSITMALSNGAREIIPSESIASASEIASGLNRNDLLLCGERDGKLVEGFDLGNSPADYTRDRVRGRTLVFGTTNGTPALIRASVSHRVFLCGFVNMNSVVDKIAGLENPFPLAVLCAGKNLSFAMEDSVCGGMLIDKLTSRLTEKFRLNDAGKAAMILYKDFSGDILSLLRQCNHGEYLIEIGMESDLPICASDSVLPVVPELKDGSFVSPKKSNQQP